MKLKDKLENHYKAFGKSKISPDPLEMLHIFENDMNKEVMGFISSIYAYGNIKQIIRSQEKILMSSEYNPYKFILNLSHKDENKLSFITHRFYTGNDTIKLFRTLSYIYNEYGSIKNHFLKYYTQNDKNLKNAIEGFSSSIINFLIKKKALTQGTRFMFPLPSAGSACKRMNLFLRWMIRKDELDFGIWDEIPTSKLIIPVDTHIARICKELKLTKLNNVSWKMAEEITDNLRKFDPNDPVKYDFAICHIGMRKLEF
ncbi:MAG: TIGR02757 family protein [Ignavibacteriaceae bacterium]|nr:TIGR02757 family protein [Ignavibacteriaceae bacterium]